MPETPLDPTYTLAMVGGAYVTRRLGSSTTHLVEWDHPLVLGSFITAYRGIPAPAVAVCGAVLRDPSGPLVVMREPTSVSCYRCKRWDYRRA